MKKTVALLLIPCLLMFTPARGEESPTRQPLIASKFDRQALVRTTSGDNYFFEVCDIVPAFVAIPTSLLEYLKLPGVPCTPINSFIFKHSDKASAGQIVQYFSGFAEKNIRENQASNDRANTILWSILGMTSIGFFVLGLKTWKVPDGGKFFGGLSIIFSATSGFAAGNNLYLILKQGGVHLNSSIEQMEILDERTNEAHTYDRDGLFKAIVLAIDQATTIVFNNGKQRL